MSTPVKLEADEIVATVNLLKTTDYEKFKHLPGNRDLDMRHVRRIAKSMREDGNMLDLFPIRVNKEFHIIDGKHRLKAAELNKYPAVYEVSPNATIATTLVGNTNNKNWTWFDFAESHAGRGNENYQQFLELYKKHRFNFQILLSYCSLSIIGKFKSTEFNHGNFVMKNYALVDKLLEQLGELSVVADQRSRVFAMACLKLMRTPAYDHQKMLTKLELYGERLNNCYTSADYFMALHEIQDF